MYAVNVFEAVYEHGNSDFCKQKEVKVKPLLCKRHFYCRTCNDFSPKFQRGDLHCKICSERWRQRTEEGLKKVDCFLDAETSKGVNKNSDMAIGVDGELISFDTTNKKEDSDDDLTGNNDEWEHLLQDMSETTERKTKKEKHVNKKKKKLEKHLPLVPRDVSFLKLVLPSANPTDSYTTGSSCADVPSCSFEQQTMLPSEEFDDKKFTRIENAHEIPYSKMQPFTEVQEEIERGTSPVKSRGKRQTWGWLPDSSKFEGSHDNEYELLIDIEGPVESPRYSDGGETVLDEQYDEFWDF